jgi:hypothetical protein
MTHVLEIMSMERKELSRNTVWTKKAGVLAEIRTWHLQNTHHKTYNHGTLIVQMRIMHGSWIIRRFKLEVACSNNSRQNAELFNVKAGSKHSNHVALKV